MDSERTKPLTTGEAKAALVDWGRSVDHSLGSVFRRHRTAILAGAVAVGVVASLLHSRRGTRRRR